ncbi:F0F1 ATP synthase subunit B/delta [Jongsikchunia kroppenstedtii]|uniref:F0F1 ATP synthase subunit B/delta n=1 Tax=Jongsikchunia kroppenstedtii TaxID=1121721 RepID=UPI00037E515B|nr:F0F1 ATP synthase subunit B/delta [Jongsikchunia kroppenstedtii]
MGIFIGQLVGFLVVVFILWRYVRPPVKKAMAAQQETIAAHISEHDEAKAQLAQAKEAHAKALEEARAEASAIREEARGDAQAIAEEMKTQADKEVARVGAQGTAQADLTRANLVRNLRTDLGLASVDVAGSLVREHLKDPAAQADSVDRFIGELERMAQDGADSAAIAEQFGNRSLRAASRDALGSVQQQFDTAIAGKSIDEVTTAANDLAAVTEVLKDKPVLRKHLAEPSDDTAAKHAMVDQLFGGKISPIALDVVRSAAAAKWSQASDLTKGLERIARAGLLVAAERDGKLEDTEDELFRAGRLLVAEPQLTGLLSDSTTPLDGRLQLLNSVLGSKVNAHTNALLTQTVRLARIHRIDGTVADIAELAAARRGESVAHVIAAAPLSDAQNTRLATVLGRVYRREISVQTETDAALLGGLKITVGDEVIEGDIATRLAKAAESLPR